MGRCICCPILSGCGSNCYIPTTIDLTLTVGAMTNPLDFTPTADEEDLIADVVDGTYVLEYSSSLVYSYSLTGGAYDKLITVQWSCTETNPVLRLNALFCENAASQPYNTFFAKNANAGFTPQAWFSSSDAESIPDYCAGATEIVNTSVEVRFLKQGVQCAPASLGDIAIFDLDVLIEA